MASGVVDRASRDRTAQRPRVVQIGPPWPDLRVTASWCDDNCIDHRRQQGHRIRNRSTARRPRRIRDRRGEGCPRGAEATGKLKAEGADARFLRLDVTDAGSIGEAAAWIEREFGKLDILVNNAGITGGVDGDGKRSSTELSTLREVYETNVFGVVAVTNAMQPLLRRADAGRIVDVSSEVGSLTLMMDPDGPMWPIAAIAYPSSKTALTMVTAMYAPGAEVAVHLATLPADGPSGPLWGHRWGATGDEEYGVLPW
ncbi:MULTISPECIES: SDR family NAD(P)-dependent oxidoreductase [Nocardia]|uniref:SDR family NAD(P)-dependent oxidoreductase n=1 Tax=Nocardia abscessus TaxID=120957 RepID=UPI00313AD557